MIHIMTALITSFGGFGELPPRAEAAPIVTSADAHALASRTGMARRRLTVDLFKADIREVMRLIAREGRVNIVLDPKITGRVSVRVKGVLVEQVFRSVLASNGLTFTRVGEVVYVKPY